MQKTTISHIHDFLNQDVELSGWIYNKRSSGSIVFLQFRDGTGFIQGVVVKKEVPENVFAAAEKVEMESSVILRGNVREEKRSPSGFELTVSDLDIIQGMPDYPISKKDHGPDFLLDNRHLWLRSSRQWAIQRVRNEVIYAIYDFMRENGFIKIDAPILTPSACEGTTTLFEVDYFGDKVYLSQSGQLYIEAAIFSHARVFDFGPTFRAEKSKTRRHLIEFWMMDAEMAFADYLENIRVQEMLISFIVEHVLKNCGQEMKLLERNTAPLEKVKPPFVRMTYTETLVKLHELGSDIKEGEDLGNDDETILTQAFDQPIFVTHYPAEVKAFYMKRDETGKHALCDDLLAPEGYGEIIGGSQREEDYETIVTRIKEHHLSPEAFSWYLDLRKYGSVVHAGFGLGIERVVTWICGLPHVRESIPFPRMLGRYSP